METRKNIIDRDTLIPLGVVISMFALIFTAYSYLDSRFNMLDRRLERMEDKERAASSDRWTYTQHRLWVSELRRTNPSLAIPDPEK